MRKGGGSGRRKKKENEKLANKGWTPPGVNWGEMQGETKKKGGKRVEGGGKGGVKKKRKQEEEWAIATMPEKSMKERPKKKIKGEEGTDGLPNPEPTTFKKRRVLKGPRKGVWGEGNRRGFKGQQAIGGGALAARGKINNSW